MIANKDRLRRRPLSAIIGSRSIDLDTAVKRGSTLFGRTAKAPLSGIARELKQVTEDFGLTMEELAELLSAHTGKYVSRTALGGWLRGAKPRIAEDALRGALERIRADEGHAKTPRYVSPVEVQAQMKKWLKILSRRQIQLAGQLPQSTQHAMEAGLVRCETRRWNRIRSLVEMWIASAQEAGALNMRDSKNGS